MSLFSFTLLVLLGILGIAPWLGQRQPASASALARLEPARPWIGVLGLAWGLYLLLRWLGASLAAPYAIGAAVIGLLSTLVILALSLLLALPVLASWFGNYPVYTRIASTAQRLGPYRIGLGFACLLMVLFALFERLLG